MRYQIVMLAVLLGATVPLQARMFSLYRSNGLSAVSLFGYRWGWQGDRKLSAEEIDTVLEANEAIRRQEEQLRKQLREKYKGDRKKIREEIKNMRRQAKVMRQEIRASAKDVRDAGKLDTSEPRITETLTSPQQYEMMGDEPAYMVYTARRSYFRLIQYDQKARIPVRWRDQDGGSQVAIQNGTDQLLFIDGDFDQSIFSWRDARKIFGVMPGKTRRINHPKDGRIGIWKPQLSDESVDELLSVIQIPAGVAKMAVFSGDEGLCIKVLDYEASDDAQQEEVEQ